MNYFNKKSIPQLFFYLSIVAVIFSAMDFIYPGKFWLNASTWLLLAAVLGIWSLYLRK